MSNHYSATRSLYRRFGKMPPQCERCDKLFCPCHTCPVRIDEIHLHLRLWLCVSCARKFIHGSHEYAKAFSVFLVVMPNGQQAEYPIYLVAVQQAQCASRTAGACEPM